jgi:hypothetical protein
MEALPQDVLERILIFAGKDVKDVGRYAQVCDLFRKAASMRVFQTLAELRFGRAIAALSEPLYSFDWKALMLDDNKRGAMPTIPGPFVCNWRHNSRHAHYCCIIHSIKWVRFAQELRIYIDVRGEDDLRHPQTSTITRSNLDGDASLTITHLMRRAANVVRPIHVLQAAGFVADSESPYTPRSFRGYLVFHIDDHIWAPGNYSFRYANDFPDYLPVNLFTISPGAQGLNELFDVDPKVGMSTDSPNRPASYTADESPFADDTPEKVKSRWERVIPTEVMNRTPSWYI